MASIAFILLLVVAAIGIAVLLARVFKGPCGRQQSIEAQVALETVRPTLLAAEATNTSAPTALKRVGVDDVLAISLDRSPRWHAHTVPQMLAAGFVEKDFRRWRAVNGRALSERALQQLLTPNRQYVLQCSEQQLSGDDGRYTLGAVGCALSHWAAWYHVATHPDVRAALVVEDDVEFDVTNAPQRIAALVREAGEFDIMRLDAVPSAREHRMCYRSEPFSEHLVRERGLTYSAAAYVVTKRGARKLLHRALPLYEHIDHHPSYLAALYPTTFVALQVPRSKAFVRQNRLLQSTIRTRYSDRK